MLRFRSREAELRLRVFPSRAWERVNWSLGLGPWSLVSGIFCTCVRGQVTIRRGSRDTSRGRGASCAAAAPARWIKLHLSNIPANVHGSANCPPSVAARCRWQRCTPLPSTSRYASPAIPKSPRWSAIWSTGAPRSIARRSIGRLLPRSTAAIWTWPRRTSRLRPLIHPTWNPGDPSAFYDSFTTSKRRIAIPEPGEQLALLIEFSGGRLGRQIKRIVVNDVELDDLVDPLHNLQLVPRDYEGRVGLFNYGKKGGATFSNFDFSNLEKE